MSVASRIKAVFQEKFHSEPLLVRSPGRINLIGEHTDYNNGFVLPAAIDKAIYLGFAKNGRQECRVFSVDFEQEVTFSLEAMQPRKGWINFVMGVAAQLVKAGHRLEGFDCVFGGDIPIGAGLSSSAALENGVGFGLNELFGLALSPLEMLQFSQQAEHEFAGVQCGIMDMFASMMGKKDHAIRLDCRSLAHDFFPVELGDYQFLLCNSMVSHSLAESAYNERRKECQQGVDRVKARFEAVNSLRDISKSMLDTVKHELSGKIFQRCAFVIEENERVQQTCEALSRNDLDEFGTNLYKSHDGLSRDYEVSCPEMDFLVDFTRELPHVLGARMMGGGFGGCTINLIKKGEKENFKRQIGAAYQARYGKLPETYEIKIVDGTSLYES
ncbi:galactokinase [Cyclobacterium lianum]|uniref:Galactokinase n=1 Tax=Cyclobacterium lianum TaxID=388280 RepID=A0A1M7Q1U1_9BACT|nr:galactokinase [Cyclobacterium lianum]SHN24048.1 galactokinase [Cyclobacterium lianum]